MEIYKSIYARMSVYIYEDEVGPGILALNVDDLLLLVANKLPPNKLMK